MTPATKKRATSLGWVLADDVSEALGVNVDELGQEWRDFCDAMALAVFASEKMERIAATGVVAFTAANLP